MGPSHTITIDLCAEPARPRLGSQRTNAPAGSDRVCELPRTTRSAPPPFLPLARDIVCGGQARVRDRCGGSGGAGRRTRGPVVPRKAKLVPHPRSPLGLSRTLTVRPTPPSRQNAERRLESVCSIGLAIEHGESRVAQERPNRLAEWVVVVRTQAPVLRRRLGEYIHAVREQPILLWETPVVRYGVYGTGLVLAAFLLAVVGRSFLPHAHDARPPAATADFHVVCTTPSCGRHFVINRKFGFDDFPVECPACRKTSGMSAVRCTTDECRGRWVVPRVTKERRFCPDCGKQFPPM